MKKNTNAERIAGEFLRLLRQDIGPDHYAEVCVRNANEANPNVCHSHDFCDANITMADAIEKVLGRAVDLYNDEDDALWSVAWNLAHNTMVQQTRGTR